MKKIVAVILLLLLIFAFFNRSVIEAKAADFLYQSPCDTPKLYSIGTVDEGFQISNLSFAEAIFEAADIWNTAYGKELFFYDPKSRFAVQLIYDSRQSLNTEISQKKQALEQEDSAVKPEIAEYNRRSAALQGRINQLNQEISEWNNAGGAPRDVYDRLISEQNQLQREAEELNARAKSLFLKTREINAKAQDLNQAVDTFNYELGFKPEGGRYILDPKGERIEIHLYTNHQELVNVLAHEMGHALGLNHVNNPESIMFSKTNGIIFPSSDDLIELKLACRERNIIETEFTKFLYAFHHSIYRIVNNIR